MAEIEAKETSTVREMLENEVKEETPTPTVVAMQENEDKGEETPIVEIDKHKPSASYVNLKVYCNTIKDDTFFKLNRNSKMKRLLLFFCRRASIDYRTTRFLINGRIFSHEKTPNQLELQENEQINAMVDTANGA